MTSTSSSGNTSAPTSSSASQAVDWNSVIPKDVVNEDSMSAANVNKIWEKMYREVGMATASEGERRALRAGVYVYCAKNGTSREGDYAGSFVLSTGKTVAAAVIPRACGKMMIRKFLRGNGLESYMFFKQTGVMEQDERFVSKAAELGIPPDCAFAMADWLDNCPMFTPSERKAHNVTFSKSIERARRARGGKTLEEVEEKRVDDAIHVNGPAVDNGHTIEF